MCCIKYSLKRNVAQNFNASFFILTARSVTSIFVELIVKQGHICYVKCFICSLGLVGIVIVLRFLENMCNFLESCTFSFSQCKPPVRTSAMRISSPPWQTIAKPRYDHQFNSSKSKVDDISTDTRKLPLFDSAVLIWDPYLLW